MQQDFTLPTCYTVANVQPLRTRIPSFSDETLFYIFYSMPRDIMQELVAEELMGRKWRYHKVERAWLTRDESYASPVEVERGVSERGVYLWWDTNAWKKVRVSVQRSHLRAIVYFSLASCALPASRCC
jgi:CCR4-NOT transcription complex subunit 2